MTTPILPSRNEGYGFFATMTVCPLRDRRTHEVWTLASTMIATAIGASSEDEMIGIRDFLDSRMGRHFADEVTGALHGGLTTSEEALAAAIREWQGRRISRATGRAEGIAAGRPHLTGWVRHFAVMAGVEDAH